MNPIEIKNETFLFLILFDKIYFSYTVSYLLFLE